MAKNTGILRFRRKVGEFVGAKGRNGENVIRKHVDTIYNPRTNAQLAQRIKIAPAQNFYAALGDILDHSWQGVRYGADSMSRFMSHALKMAEGFPYVTKGTKEAWPGSYLVSSGALNGVDFKCIDKGLILKGDYHATNTIGNFSQMLIEHNPGLQNGDQLTFILCYIVNEAPVYMTGRFFIDTENTSALPGLTGSDYPDMGSLIFTAGDTNYPEYNSGYEITVKWSRNDIAGNTTECIAAACIASRPPRRKGAWLRSNTKMKCTSTYKAIYMGPVRLQHAMDSYAVEENAPNSEYYLNGGSGETSGGSGSGSIVITLTSDNEAAVSQLTGAGSYQRGALVSVSAPSSTGEGSSSKRFSGWYEDGNFVSDADIYAFTASVNRTLQARYTVNDEP